jgi:hypothetical protein
LRPPRQYDPCHKVPCLSYRQRNPESVSGRSWEGSTLFVA